MRVAEVSRAPAARARRAWEAIAAHRMSGLPWLLIGGLAAVYAVSFLAHLHEAITSLLWNSDYASGFTLTQTLAQFGSAGNTVISTTGAWADLWYGLLTAHLPLHRELWEISPTLLFLISALVLGRAVWRVSNLTCAVGAALVILLASPWTLAILLAPVAHNTVYPSTVVLGAALPWVLRRGRIRLLSGGLLVVAAAVVLGADIASDKLLLITGVAPLGLLALVTLAQPGPRARIAGAATLLTIALSVPCALATDAIMKAEGYAITAPDLRLAPLSAVPAHLRTLWHEMRDLSNGYLDTAHPGALHSELGFACTVVLAVGLLALAAGAAPAVVALARRRPVSQAELAQLLHLGYWLVSAVIVLAAFIFTNAIGDGLGNHESYFLTVLYSVAAVAPFAVRRWAVGRGAFLRWVAPLALGVFGLGSVVGSQEAYIATYRPPLAAVATTIVQLARANHATTGYAGYWDSSNITWSEKGAVDVRPLEQCANPNPKGSDICPFLLMRTATWYHPRPRRTFLLVDPSNLYVTSLPDQLGTPLASYQVGPVTMYVFSYDIASKLGPYP